jgi:PKD domain/PASTA domain
MSGKTSFLISLLTGSLAVVISIAAITDFSKNRSGPYEKRSISREEPTAGADVPDEAVDSDPEEPSQGNASGQGEVMSGARVPLDKRPGNPLPAVESDRPRRISAVSAASPASAPSHTADVARDASSKQTEQMKIPSLPVASAIVPTGSPEAAPNSVDPGFPRRKIPMLAKDQSPVRFSPPPPPVLDTPTENQGTDPDRGGDPTEPDDNAGDQGVDGNEPANNPPSADAGGDRTVFVGDSVVLDGSGSSDRDGDPLTFRWSFVTRPLESRASIADPSAALSTFTADVPGVFIVQLVVDDGSDESLPLSVVVTAEMRGLTVPCVVGLNLTEARTVMIDAGIRQIRVNTVPAPDIPKNQVMEQQPAAGSPMLETTAVSLLISFPPQDDDDRDGLPDAWEYARFGNLEQKGDDDIDGDGYTNFQEYRVGTDPADKAEAPVPAGNFFEYDAFGRILVKQITLEP